MTLGERLISELGRRGELGGYFDDYRAYKSLHGVTTADELARFLSSQSYAEVTVSSDVTQVADGLQATECRREVRAFRRVGLSRLGLGLLGLALFLLFDSKAALVLGIVLLYRGRYFYLFVTVLGYHRVRDWLRKKRESRRRTAGGQRLER